jgi:integrase
LQYPRLPRVKSLQCKSFNRLCGNLNSRWFAGEAITSHHKPSQPVSFDAPKMPRTQVSVREIQHHGNTRWQVLVPRHLRSKYGQGKKNFTDETKAAKFARELNASRQSWAGRLLALSDDDQGRLIRALETAGSVEALERAAEQCAKLKVAQSKALGEAVKECVAAKDQARRSWQYVGNLTVALNQFAVGRETRAVSEITSTEIEDWLHGNGWSASTQTTYLRRLETFFLWAIKRGYAAANPTAAVEKPDNTGGAIAILSVAECRHLLKTCCTHDPKLVSYFAIGLFAGIRPDEIKRLHQDNIRGEWIHIEAAKAKTRRRRLVEIHPTLAAWLKFSGGIGWRNWRRRFRKLITQTKIEWHNDVMRHSFCSYAYPIKGAHWTSMHAGHSEQTLFRNYRELVTLEAAREFWSITPESITKSPAAST